MKMFNCQRQLSYVISGFILRESHLSGEVKTEISSRTIVESKVEIVRGLKGEVKVDDKLMICLL